MILARLENLLTVAGINLKKLLTRNELKLIIIMDSHPTYEELKLWFGDYVYTHLFELFEDAYINASRREQEKFLKEVMAEYGDRIKKSFNSS